ncbi:MAG: putative glycoside hydrolase [Candidatus Thermoplasmatota archaeon]
MYKKIAKPYVFKLLALLIVASLFLSGCMQDSEDQSDDVESLTFLNISTPPETDDISEGTPHGWKGEYTEIFFNDFESSNPELGLDFSNYAELTDNAIDGKKAIKIEKYHSLQTNPETLPLSPDKYYIFEFDYKILKRGNTGEAVVETFFYPEGANNEDNIIHCMPLLSNAVQEGSFSSGALTTNNFDAYYLKISSHTHTSIIIDNIKIYRLDPVPITNPPERWDNLDELPYPRLGSYGGHTSYWATDAGGTAPNFPEDEHVYQVEELEERLAFFDVVVGPIIDAQTYDTSFVKRLREKNSNITVLPYRVTHEQGTEKSRPPHATISPHFQFLDDMAEEWIVTDTSGSKVLDADMEYIWKMDFSENCPVVNGQTYTDYLIDWVVNNVMASGVWDGIFFDNLKARINPHIKNYTKPSLFDYDINHNGKRDETPAEVTEMARSATIELLQRLRTKLGDNALIVGNCGWNPDLCLASYINGYTFESWMTPWYDDNLLQFNEGLWRRSLDDYFKAEKNTRAPQINILEGAGYEGKIISSGEEVNRNYLEPTDQDIDHHRFGLGTVLLNDGFYEYDLYDMRSPATWFDEYSVNENGVAVENREYKGYLGMPLGDAVELKSNGTIIWEESFDSGNLPSSMQGEGTVENNRLVINNPVHTQADTMLVNTKTGGISFRQDETYLVEFDWKILETLDYRFSALITCSEGVLGSYMIPELIKGESGSVSFPVTLNDDGDFKLKFLLKNGGKVAVDNLKVYEGGAGPWRRDFENGFVLVNPLNKPYTFNTSELSGVWNRTGIKRIFGSQAPEVNTGEKVAGSLTLQPFDAIILLADSIQSI